MVNGDAPGDGATGSASGGSSDEAAWQDLIARFDVPVPEAGDGTPWPDREDLAAPGLSPAAPGTATDPPGTTTDPGTATGPVITGGPAYGPGSGPRDSTAPADPEDEHYIPPEPPPLPKLNPATKLAWLALFGGPAYLLVFTAMGWPVSGLAAFLCVAAFIGGFAALVIRMDNGGPPDSGPDDGAVV